MLAPICLFTYNRLNETQQTVEALKCNFLAPQSCLYIFSDAPENETITQKVNEVRQYIKTINGFKTIKIFESTINKGLANSIIDGVTQIIEKYGTVIVLEDDLITSPNFLDFMNHALQFYQNRERVLSISGYSFSINYPKDYQYDMAFGFRASSWGWATWMHRWNKIDWTVNDYSSFRWNIRSRLSFNRGGSDMSHMLDKQMRKEINSWAIRFCYHQFKHNYIDIYPVKSKVINIGFSSNGTNCKFDSKRYLTQLDNSDKRSFDFCEELIVDKTIFKQFVRHYSFSSRLYDKIKRVL